MNIQSLLETRLWLKEWGRNGTSETAHKPPALCGQSFAANAGLCRAKKTQNVPVFVFFGVFLGFEGRLLQQGTLQGSPSLPTATPWQILCRKYESLALRAHPNGDTRCLVSAREHLQTLARDNLIIIIS